jgi:hypothetical protein
MGTTWRIKRRASGDFIDDFRTITVTAFLTQCDADFIPGQNAIDIYQNRFAIRCGDMRDTITTRTNLFNRNRRFEADQRITTGWLTLSSPTGTGITVMMFHELSLGGDLGHIFSGTLSQVPNARLRYTSWPVTNRGEHRFISQPT